MRSGRSLRAKRGVAALTAQRRARRRADACRATPCSRSSRRAMPGARGAARAERIDLLITTDLLSEGLNLQEASVIVHLDLPWNPARLDQRVGRALRLGSRHEAVTVYSIAPPASAERLLRIETRLRDKLSVAQRTIGVAGRILPSPLVRVSARSRARRAARATLDVRAARLARPCPDDRATICRVCRGVRRRERHAGFSRVVRDGRSAAARRGHRRLASTTRRRRSQRAHRDARAVLKRRRTHGESPRRLAQIERWLSARRGAAAVDLRAASAARFRRATLDPRRAGARASASPPALAARAARRRRACRRGRAARRRRGANSRDARRRRSARRSVAAVDRGVRRAERPAVATPGSRGRCQRPRRVDRRSDVLRSRFADRSDG